MKHDESDMKTFPIVRFRHFPTVNWQTHEYICYTKNFCRTRLIFAMSLVSASHHSMIHFPYFSLYLSFFHSVSICLYSLALFISFLRHIFSYFWGFVIRLLIAMKPSNTFSLLRPHFYHIKTICKYMYTI